ncbi:MAG: DUF2065 domain-containing protein [Devosiaceae bacterium]|nr:DUF2065 domain-containing protein [Devosiaceae bacterium MH13]
MLELIVLVLGGALVAEGLFYALFPGAARQMLAMVEQMNPQTLRVAGVVSLAIGVGLFYVARTWLAG